MTTQLQLINILLYFVGLEVPAGGKWTDELASEFRIWQLRCFLQPQRYLNACHWVTRSVQEKYPVSLFYSQYLHVWATYKTENSRLTCAKVYGPAATSTKGERSARPLRRWRKLASLVVCCVFAWPLFLTPDGLWILICWDGWDTQHASWNWNANSDCACKIVVEIKTGNYL